MDPAVKASMEERDEFDTEGALNDFRTNFKFKQASTAKSKGKKRFWSDVTTGSTTAGADASAPAKAAKTGDTQDVGAGEDNDDEDLDFESNSEVTEISSVNTVSDFIKLFSTNKSKAKDGMQTQIAAFVKEADDENYSKGLKCMQQLRTSSLTAATDADGFNTFMQTTVKVVKVGGRI